MSVMSTDALPDREATFLRYLPFIKIHFTIQEVTLDINGGKLSFISEVVSKDTFHDVV